MLLRPLCTLSLLLLLAASPAASTQPADISSALDDATSVCLVEIQGVTRVGHPPNGGDGNFYVDVIQYKILKQSGDPPAYLYVNLIPSGRFSGGDGPAFGSGGYRPFAPVYPIPLTVGTRIWIALDSVGKSPTGLYWWPEDSAAAKPLEDAITRDRFAWHPRLDAASGLFYGYKVDAKKDTWSARAWTKEKLLWEETFTTKFSTPGPDVGPFNIQPHDRELGAQWRQTINADNPYALPAGEFETYLKLDFKTGMQLAFNLHRSSPLAEVSRYMDRTTGKLNEEIRVETLDHGGLAAGELTDNWVRTTETYFDPDGKVKSRRFYRGPNISGVLIQSE